MERARDMSYSVEGSRKCYHGSRPVVPNYRHGCESKFNPEVLCVSGMKDRRICDGKHNWPDAFLICFKRGGGLTLYNSIFS